LRARLEWGPAAAADLLRPSAEEARPDERTSDALCHATAPERHGFHSALRRRPHPPALRPTARTPPRQVRRCRRRFRTTAPNEPERLPSDRPEPCGPGRLHRACSYTRTASPRTLSLAASLAHLVKGWGVASNYPALIRLASRRAEPGSKKMRLPTSATDRRHEHPADPSIPGRASLGASRPSGYVPCGTAPACPRREPRADHPGGASLDGDPPASALSQPLCGGPGVLAPDPTRARRLPVLAELRSTAPPADAPGHGVLDREPSMRRGL
jgi:hypothetical protein